MCTSIYMGFCAYCTHEVQNLEIRSHSESLSFQQIEMNLLLIRLFNFLHGSCWSFCVNHIFRREREKEIFAQSPIWTNLFDFLPSILVCSIICSQYKHCNLLIFWTNQRHWIENENKWNQCSFSFRQDP